MAAEIDSSLNFREDRVVNGNFGKVQFIEGGRGTIRERRRVDFNETIGEKKTLLSEFERTEPEIGTLQSLRQLMAKSWI
jgi:hypothetical protein